VYQVTPIATGPERMPPPRRPMSQAQRRRVSNLIKQAKDACLLLKLDNPGLDEATMIELNAAAMAVTDLEVVAAGQYPKG
jgi:CTP:molybdopterin cytidylyltransferase MocA